MTSANLWQTKQSRLLWRSLYSLHSTPSAPTLPLEPALLFSPFSLLLVMYLHLLIHSVSQLTNIEPVFIMHRCCAKQALRRKRKATHPYHGPEQRKSSKHIFTGHCKGPRTETNTVLQELGAQLNQQDIVPKKPTAGRVKKRGNGVWHVRRLGA